MIFPFVEISCYINNMETILSLFVITFIMEFLRKDTISGNTVVNFYPVKSWGNVINENVIFKVVEFMAGGFKTYSKQLVRKDTFEYDIQRMTLSPDWELISEYMPPQFINSDTLKDFVPNRYINIQDSSN